MKGRLFKRLLAGAAAAAMCLSMTVMTAFAAEATPIGEGTGTINVTVYDTKPGTAGDGLTPPMDTTQPVEGVGIEYRRIGSVAQVTTDNGETQIAFSVDDLFAGVLGLTKDDVIATVDAVAYYDTTVVQNAVQNTSAATLEVLDATASRVTDKNGAVSFVDIPVGLYLLTKSELPANATTNVDPFLVAVPMYIEDTGWSTTVNVYPKVRMGAPIEPEKSVGEGYEIVNAGETIPFTITTTIEASERTFESLKYVDVNPGKTLNIDRDSLDVKLNGTSLTKDAEYTATPAVNGNDNEMTIELTTTGLAKLNANIGTDQIIAITYNATINTTVANLVTDINNMARLTYERDGDIDATESDDTETIHTYGIDLTKTLSDGAAVAADSVKFELRKDSAEGDAIAMTGSDGQYWFAAENEASAVTEVTVAAGGSLKLNGLDEGTYYLTETATQSGYTKLAEPIKIVITATPGDNETMTMTATVDGVEATVTGGAVNLTVENTKNDAGFKLPQTGGAGTLAVTMIGVGLLAVAVILVAVSRKKTQK